MPPAYSQIHFPGYVPTSTQMPSPLPDGSVSMIDCGQVAASSIDEQRGNGNVSRLPGNVFCLKSERVKVRRGASSYADGVGSDSDTRAVLSIG
jgi:hypothetical protein